MSKKKSICILVIFTIFFTSCVGYKYWWGKRPCDQPGTQWVSEDNLVNFIIDEHGEGIGNLQTETERKDIYFSIGPAITIDIYTEMSDGQKEYIEQWTGDFSKEDRFTAKVKKTTYFKAGQKIKFYRVDNEIQEEK